MKALRYHAYGDPTVQQIDDVDVPEPGSGEVLLKVIAAGLNPSDAMLRSGALESIFPVELPHIPCVDVSGTIAKVGEGVTGWAEGTAVATMTSMTGQGSAAEYVVVSAADLAAIPGGVDPVDAASLPGSGLTAWQALFEHGHLSSGQRVLINGAGGAVGSHLVQLAHAAGAEVVATASPRSADRVRGHGADLVLDYTTAPITETAPGSFDLVVNVVPTTPAETDALAALVQDGGVFVTATTPVSVAPGRGVEAIQMGSHPDAEQLTELMSRVADGSLTLEVSDRRPLEDLPAVQAEIENGAPSGKVVFLP